MWLVVTVVSHAACCRHCVGASVLPERYGQQGTSPAPVDFVLPSFFFCRPVRVCSFAFLLPSFLGFLTVMVIAWLKLLVLIVMIALKGAITDFLQSPHCFANCLRHESSSGSGAFVCKACAAHKALTACNMLYATRYEGTAQPSSLTELKLHLF